MKSKRYEKKNEYSHRRGLKKYGVPSLSMFDTGADDWIQIIAAIVAIIIFIALVIATR